MEPPAPKWKEKERGKILKLFCLASLASGKGVGLSGRPAPSTEDLKHSFQFPTKKKKKSSKIGNWPWFPRAEIESSTLNHFLCSVTTHEGISTNPLSCHGFRSWTWAKPAWDIPAPRRGGSAHRLICLAPGPALENFSTPFPSPAFPPGVRHNQGRPSVGRGPAQPLQRALENRGATRKGSGRTG